MARWLLEREPEVLFDPGCGSGSLLIAATHEGVGQSRLIGVDVDPLAVEMAKCNVQIRSMSNVEIRLSDFLFEDPPDRPDAIICNLRTRDIMTSMQHERVQSIEVSPSDWA